MHLKKCDEYRVWLQYGHGLSGVLRKENLDKLPRKIIMILEDSKGISPRNCPNEGSIEPRGKNSKMWGKAREEDILVFRDSLIAHVRFSRRPAVSAGLVRSTE
jgi:hypothetical protein